MRELRHKTHCLPALFAGALMSLPGAAEAQALFDDHPNVAPIPALFLLTSDGLAPGSGWSVSSQTASHAALQSEPGASALFDGESTRLTLGWRHAITPSWSVGATFSHWWHTRGVLDGFIDGWHSAFGLPDGIRDDVPDDQIVFRYVEDGITRLDVSRTQRGAGDLTLSAQRRLGTAGDWALAMHLKLPTGSAGRVTGSGATDAGIVLAWTPARRASDRWQVSAGGGLMALGDADIDLPGQSRATWTAHGELAAVFDNQVQLGARLAAHGAISDSRLETLGEPAIWLVIGGTLPIGERHELELSVTEDIRVESAPDAVFNLRFRQRF